MNLKKEIINRIEILSYESESLTENYEKVKDFLELTVIETRSYNRKHTSYGIKHMIEDIIGGYVSNYDVKVAMAELNIIGIPSEAGCINYFYPISEKWFEFLENVRENCKEKDKKIVFC